MSGLDDFKGKITDDQFKELQKIVSNARKDGESNASKTKSTETSSGFETFLNEDQAKSFGKGFIFRKCSALALSFSSEGSPALAVFWFHYL